MDTTPFEVTILRTPQVVERNSGPDAPRRLIVTPGTIELLPRDAKQAQRVEPEPPLPPLPGKLRRNHEPARERRWRYALATRVESLATAPLQAAHELVIGMRTLLSAQGHAGRVVIDNQMPVRTLVCDLTYPLGVIARVTLEPYVEVTRFPGDDEVRTTDSSLGYVLWLLAQAYKSIYAEPETWGVFGHVLADLSFSSLEVSDNILEVDVGS